ncbi:hypothetical protein HDV02_001299 [Globomyces sp. JEL0801]|nr:hypothetical protein HDV02_001299 [Globomyces sp. JEL0801]
MNNEWLLNKSSRLDELYDLLNMVEKDLIGKSYKDAEKASQTHRKKEELMKLEPVWIKKALLQSIHNQEKLRAQYLVHNYREKMADHIPAVEIEPHSIQKANRETVSKATFDETCFHRDYAVIRCERNRLLNVLILAPKKNRPDVFKEALIETDRARHDLMEKAMSRQQFAKQADDRYKSVLHTMYMNKKRTQLFKDMTSIYREDRHRKQTNATIHAASFRPHYIRVGVDKLTSKFEDQFHIGDIENLPKAKSVQKRRPLDTISNSSFEFIKAGDALLVNKPSK